MLCVTHVTTLSSYMNTGLSEVQHRGLCCDVKCCDRKYEIQCKVKVKESHYRPGGFQEVKVPRFRDDGTGW